MLCFSYDSRGMAAYTNTLNQVTRYVRDEAGRLLYQTNANAETLSFTYYPDDQMKALKDGRGTSTLWTCDMYGRVTMKTLLAYQAGSSQDVLRYYYDAESRMTNRWSAGKGGSGYSTYYAYDRVGNLTNIAYPTLTISYRYDALNRLTNMTDAAGSTAFTWTDGNLFESEQGRWTSDKVTFSYQHRKRSGLALQRPGTSDWTQGYLYDDFGRLKSITSPAGGFTNTAYQSGSFDLVSTFDYPGGSQVTAGYDVMGRLYAKHLYGGGLSPDNHEYSYDAGSQRTQHVFYADMPSYAYDSTDYTYDNIGQLKSARSFEYYGNTRRHEQFGYTYDASWNLIRRTNNNLVAQFQANGLNQVTNSTRTGTLTVHGLIAPPSSTATVTVSGTGLSTTPADVYTDGAWASQSGATPANGLNTYTATVTDNGQSSQQTVTAYLPSSVTYQYDLNGNLTNDGLRTLEYDFENQLTNVFVTAGWRSEFKYDGLGRRRVRKEYTWAGSAWSLTNEVRYVYDGRLPIQERDGANAVKVTYTRGQDLSGTLEGAGGIGGLLARTDSAGHAYYSSDANGNVTCLFNSSGQAVARYHYDPYGNLMSMSGTLAAANLYRFSSKEAHANSGLVYYLYRYYSPNLQRWVNRDPIDELGGINMHRFAGNSPIDLVDLFGLTDYPGGHHYVVRELWKNWGQCPARDVFRNATLDPVNSEHLWSEPHMKYNLAVLDEWKQFKQEKGLVGRARPSSEQAHEFLDRIKNSQRPEIHKFLKDISPSPKPSRLPTPRIRPRGLGPKGSPMRGLRGVCPGLPELDPHQFYEYKEGAGWVLVT